MDPIGDLFLNPYLYVAPILVGLLVFVAATAWMHVGTKHAELVREVVQYAGIFNSKYQLVQGPTSRYYFDADLFLGLPSNVDLALDWILEVVEAEQRRTGSLNRIAFIERRDGPMGAVTLKDLVSWKTRIPSLIVRPDRKGPARRMKGAAAAVIADNGRKNAEKRDWRLFRDDMKERVLIVSDAATSGSSLGAAVEIIRANGGEVNCAVVLFDRDEGARMKLKEMGVELEAFAKYTKEVDASSASVHSA